MTAEVLFSFNFHQPLMSHDIVGERSRGCKLCAILGSAGASVCSDIRDPTARCPFMNGTCFRERSKQIAVSGVSQI